jgi:predicted phage terminase large subunit-like protein
MQRVHHEDLTGHLARLDGWTVLELAAIAQDDQSIPIGDGRIYLRRAGEALHPERESVEDLERIRHEVGSQVFDTQYQQKPIPATGNMIKRDWLRYYTTVPTGRYKKVIISVDTAAKGGAHNSYSAFTVWTVVDGRYYYLTDAIRGRYDYPKLREVTISLATHHKPDVILIEDTSTGTALAQQLKNEVPYPVKAIAVDRDKVSRLFVQQQKFEAGQVFFTQRCIVLTGN